MCHAGRVAVIRPRGGPRDTPRVAPRRTPPSRRRDRRNARRASMISIIATHRPQAIAGTATSVRGAPRISRRRGARRGSSPSKRIVTGLLVADDGGRDEVVVAEVGGAEEIGGALAVDADGTELAATEIVRVHDDRTGTERARERRGADGRRLPRALDELELVHAFEEDLRRIEQRLEPRLDRLGRDDALHVDAGDRRGHGCRHGRGRRRGQWSGRSTATPTRAAGVDPRTGTRVGVAAMSFSVCGRGSGIDATARSNHRRGERRDLRHGRDGLELRHDGAAKGRRRRHRTRARDDRLGLEGHPRPRGRASASDRESRAARSHTPSGCRSSARWGRGTEGLLMTSLMRRCSATSVPSRADADPS